MTSTRSALAVAALLAALPLLPAGAADPDPAAPARTRTSGKGKAAKARKAAPSTAKGKATARGGKGRIAPLGVVQPAAAAPLPARPVGVRPLDAVGEVKTVQRGRAWLNAGAQEGLAPGQVLQLRRKGEPAGSCAVETVSDRNATCAGGGIRPGDTFAVNPRAAGSLPAQLPPRPSAEEQARRLAASQQAALPLVDFKSTKVVEPLDRLRKNEVGYAHYAWLSSDASAVHQEQLYAQVRGAEVWRGARLDLDLTAMARSAASPSERFEPGRKAQLWVREASLSFAEPGSRFRLAAGRVLPWLMPGGPTFDGAQAGWRPRSGTELGLFGGAVPDLLTTGPGASRATGGGYWSAEGVVGEKTLLRSEGRVAWLRLPDARSRFEAEATAQAWVARRLDVTLQARAATGDYAAPSKLDGARVDLAWTQPGQLGLFAGFRYQDARLPDTEPALYPGRTRQAVGGLSWDGLSWAQLRAVGGWSRDVTSGITHGWVGPELAAPRLLGRFGGAALGYAEEVGTYAGRNAWLQGDFLLGARTRLLARLSWMQDARPSPLQADNAVGLSTSMVADLAPWLRLRLAALARAEVPQSGEGSKTGWGASLMANLEGRF